MKQPEIDRTESLAGVHVLHKLIALSLLVGMMLVLDPAHALTKATPESSNVVVGSYAEIADEYTQAEMSGLEAGRAATDALFGDDPATLFAQLSPELQQLIDAEGLQALRAQFEGNNLHVEIPAIGGVADIHIDGDTMQGFLNAGGMLSLEATRSAEGSGTHIASGAWTGTASIDDQVFDLTLTLDFERAIPTGTVSVPALNIVDAPLENTGFADVMPIGERVDDAALPSQPGGSFYWARYPWGDQHLAVQIGIDAAGTITTLGVLPEQVMTPDPAGDQTVVALGVPFDGAWWVFWGGDDAMHNYHVVAPQQRHALDIMIWKNGGSFSGDGAENEDYWVWGQPIVAPADGVVVEVQDGVTDNVPGITNTDVHPGGNHVVLELPDGVFVHLSHMRNGSVQVAAGDQVQAGDLLGLAGNSGNSTAPHLHIHAQTSADMFDPASIGIPILFSNVEINGVVHEASPAVQGDVVQGVDSGCTTVLEDASRAVSQFGGQVFGISAPAQLGAIGARLAK